MKKATVVLLTILVCGFVACKSDKKAKDMSEETKLKIETTAGDIVVKLYNETPQHRDNFIKLAENGTYEGTLFHRVIKDFMIQAGDPDSKNASKGQMLGAGDVGYTVPAEFVYPKYFHKKGALSAARQGDNVNPQKASSGCQFYIVTGKVYSDSALLSMEQQMNQMRFNNLFNTLASKHAKDIYKMRKAVDQAEKMGNVGYKVGNVASSDVFYSERPTMEAWQKMGVLAVEMETAALYMNAARTGKNALTICTISDSLVTGEVTTSEERQTSFADMMKVALEIA